MIRTNKSWRNLEKRDGELKKLILRYKIYQNNKTKRKIISILSPAIVQYPILQKCTDPDLQHDFYIFVLSKFDKLFSKYNPVDYCKFSTWFSIIMNRNFWLFLKYKKREKDSKIETEIIDENLHNKYFVAEKSVEYEKDEDDSQFDFFNTILNSHLSKKEKKIIILKFSNSCLVSNEDPIFLRKMERVEMLKERINRNQFTIFKLQKLLLSCDSKKKRNEITSEIEKIKICQENKKKLLNSFYVCRSNKWVAKQLGLKTSTVSSLLMRAKKKLQKDTPIVLFPTVDNEDKKI